MRKPIKERRKHPRARGADLTVGAEPQVPEVRVRDISLSGVSFEVNSPIEFMTRLVMTLVFPARAASVGHTATPNSIQSEGVVVRCDPAQEDNGNQYEVAVFFTHLDNAAKEAIENYVRTHS